MSDSRLASSVYPDSFELEGLLDKLKITEYGRGQLAARESEAEQDAMQGQLDALHADDVTRITMTPSAAWMLSVKRG
jgi:hypothetical protein